MFRCFNFKNYSKNQFYSKWIHLLLHLGVYCLMGAGVAHAVSTPTLSIEMDATPLSMGLISIQSSTANASFYFDIRPYISEVKNRISYKVKNNLPYTLYGIHLQGDLPLGIHYVDKQTRMSDCAKTFDLEPGGMCFLHFYVDEHLYQPTLGGDPLLCSTNECFTPEVDHQLNKAVELSPGDTHLEVNPESLNGLVYHPEHFTIEGVAELPGVYLFKINAVNKFQRSSDTYLRVEVGIDPKDKPVFKRNPLIPIASPNSLYQFNLMELLESNSTYGKSNQIRFEIFKCTNGISGLSIDEENPVLLKGVIPSSEAGNLRTLCLNATSNTGGSTQGWFDFQVGVDRTQQPIIDEDIKPFHVQVDSNLRWDMESYIHAPMGASDLRIRIDEVSPRVNWLTSETTTLKGFIPIEAVGEVYNITLHAETKQGGSSIPKTVVLMVDQDPSLKPRFKSGHPLMPMLITGSSYFYDFQKNKDIYPEYRDIPYIISFDEHFENPNWLTLENNQLKANYVPNSDEDFVSIYLVLENKAGGKRYQQLILDFNYFNPKK